MIPADATFNGTWPFAPRYFEGRGFKQHYIDDGSADTGETFVLLHGEPTWGYIWRNFVPRLSQLGRVVVVDHMGFGKSETPQDRSYSAQEHVENLEALLLGIDVQGATLVMQDWGGPIGGQFALRQPDRVKRIVLIDSFVRPPGPPPANATREEMRGWSKWFELVLDDHFDDVILNLRFTALSVLQRIGFERAEIVNDSWVRAYSAPFPTAADCKGARQFPLNLLEQATYDYCDANEALPGALEALKSKPAAAFTGADDSTVAPQLVEMMLRMYWPNAPFVTIPGAGHYAQEDAPETLVALIEQFVKTTG
jgi:haloalkane dehalogenase